MIVPDINLLLYAEIAASPQHAAARRWWENALSASRPVGLPCICTFGFLRLSTSRRVFSDPLRIDDALHRVERWYAQPNVVALSGGQRHLQTAFRLLRDTRAAGNLTTDAQIAAHAIEHNAEVHSNDTDFARFEGLRWHNPLDAP